MSSRRPGVDKDKGEGQINFTFDDGALGLPANTGEALAASPDVVDDDREVAVGEGIRGGVKDMVSGALDGTSVLSSVLSFSAIAEGLDQRQIIDRIEGFRRDLAKLSGEDLAKVEKNFANDSREYRWVKREIWERTKIAWAESVEPLLLDYLRRVPTRMGRGAEKLLRLPRANGGTPVADLSGLAVTPRMTASHGVSPAVIPVVARKDTSGRDVRHGGYSYFKKSLKFDSAEMRDSMVFFRFEGDWGFNNDSIAWAYESELKRIFSAGPFSLDQPGRWGTSFVTGVRIEDLSPRS